MELRELTKAEQMDINGGSTPWWSYSFYYNYYMFSFYRSTFMSQNEATSGGSGVTAASDPSIVTPSARPFSSAGTSGGGGASSLASTFNSLYNSIFG